MVTEAILQHFPGCSTWRDVALALKELLPAQRREAYTGPYPPRSYDGVFLFFWEGIRITENRFNLNRIDTWNLIVHLMDLGYIKNFANYKDNKRDHLMRASIDRLR